MKKIFKMSKNNRVIRDRYKLNLNIPRTNQVTFGTKIWNALPFNIKTAENFNVFKT